MPSADPPQSPEYLLSKYVRLQSELAKTYLELKELRKQVDELERLVRERAQVRNTKTRPRKRPPHTRLGLRVRDAENRIEVGHKHAANEADRRAFGGAQKMEKPIMSRLAIAFVLALASGAANAQDTKSEQSQTPGVASGNGLRPFLFDGRMPGDGARGRQGSLADDRHPNAGAIVLPPKESQPERGR